MRAQPVGRWLFKEEPSHYCYADLVRDGTTRWDGVSNSLARQNLRKVKAGDRVLFYETGKVKAIVGEMCIVEDPAADANDPKGVTVRVAAVRPWPCPVSLARIKADPSLAGCDLVRLPRLSVVALSPAQWQRLVELSAGAEADTA